MRRSWAERPLAGVIQWAWDEVARWGTVRAGHRRAARFRRFGAASAICFPVAALYGERYIEIGDGTILGPYASLSAGVSPWHELGVERAVVIGDRCSFGRGTGIVAHESVTIGDDVWTGHHVYITDANHGYEDVTRPPGVQFAPPRPVVIGSGSWLGHGVIVLPGVTLGRHVVVGAGSVVAGDLPDFSVAVGNPARVVRRYVTGQGWVAVAPESESPQPAAGEG